MPLDVCALTEVLDRDEGEDEEEWKAVVMDYMGHLFSRRRLTENSYVHPVRGKRAITVKAGLGFLLEEQMVWGDVDWTTKSRLEERKALNWHPTANHFHPINANVDDDCEWLLMSKRSLNNVLHRLSNCTNLALKSELSAVESEHRVQLLLTEAEFQSPKIHPMAKSVFALAHLLSRPLIVLSDSISIAGIYLPLKKSPFVCSKCPLLFSYHMGCFSPLVPVLPRSFTDHVLLPLTSVDRQPLPLRFAELQTCSTESILVERYLNVIKPANLIAIVIDAEVIVNSRKNYPH